MRKQLVISQERLEKTEKLHHLIFKIYVVTSCWELMKNKLDPDSTPAIKPCRFTLSLYLLLLLLFLSPSRSPATRWRLPTWRWSLGPTCCRGNEDQMQALTSTLWASRTARPSSTWPWCSYRTTGGSSRYTHMFSRQIVPLHTPQQFQKRRRISSMGHEQRNYASSHGEGLGYIREILIKLHQI